MIHPPLRTTNYELRTKNGFTLIEALISVSIISIIGLIIASLLSRTFQSNTKTQLLGNIKRNGSAALTYMDQSIRGAESVVCVGNKGALTTDPENNKVTWGDTMILSYKVQDTINYTRFRITSADSSANGNIQSDHPTNIIDSRDAPSHCGSDLTLNNPANLIDADPTSGVVAVRLPSSLQGSGNFFMINRSAGSSDSVSISFALSQRINTNNRSEETIGTDTSGQVFETTIQVRK